MIRSSLRTVLGLAALIGLSMTSWPAMAEPAKVAQRFADSVINAHSVAAVDGVFTKDYKQHTPQASNLPVKAFKQFAAAMFAAFPDVKVRFTPVMQTSDKIAVLSTATGTHKGTFFGMKPTGKVIKWTEMHIFRVRGNRIAEHWVQADMFGIVQQIRAPAKKK